MSSANPYAGSPGAGHRRARVHRLEPGVRLADLGARVTLVDAMIPEYGGNLFNVEPVRDRVAVNFGDVCDRLAMNWLVKDQDYVFHLAGQVSHVMSMTDPFADIEFNIKGTAVVMEAVRHHNPRAKVVFTGTRGQYGPATQLPVSEVGPDQPEGHLRGVEPDGREDDPGVPPDARHPGRDAAADQHLRPARADETLAVRRGQLVPPAGLDGEPIRVFGTGRILRDFVYVDDCVGAILAAAACPAAVGEIFNVGWDGPASLLDLARLLERLCPGCSWQFAPFSPTGGPGAGRLLLGHHEDSHRGRLGAADGLEPGPAVDARLLSAAPGPLWPHRGRRRAEGRLMATSGPDRSAT